MALIVDANSTTTPLAGGGEFVGEFVKATRTSIATVSVLVHSDKPSVPGGMGIEWSTDGVNVDDAQEFNYTGTASGLGLVVHSTIRAQFVRVRYTNSSQPQSFLRLQTLFHDTSPSASIGYLGQPITSNEDTLVTKAVLAARQIDSPSSVVLPFATNDPFLIVDSPPSSGVVFHRSVAASETAVQLDFFGISGNRAFMSVCNNSPDGDLLVLMNAGDASPSNFTERLKPFETWRMPLSWVKYAGTVSGIWVPRQLIDAQVFVTGVPGLQEVNRADPDPPSGPPFTGNAQVTELI